LIAGTLGYLAPEVIRGEPATAASDVYALGALAYRALSGSLPYPTGTIAELVEAQAVPARPVSALRPGLGESMDAAVAGALGPGAARPTASELAAHLNLALAMMDPAALWVPAGAAPPLPGASQSGAATQAGVRIAASPAARAVAGEPTRTMGTAPGVPRTVRSAPGGTSIPRSPAVLVAGIAILLLSAFVLAGFSVPGFLLPPSLPDSGNPALAPGNQNRAASPQPSLQQRARPGTSQLPVPASPTVPMASPNPSASPPPAVRPAPTPRHHPQHHRRPHAHHDRHHGHGHED
jgi:serine/threonine-protein kinase